MSQPTVSAVVIGNTIDRHLHTRHESFSTVTSSVAAEIVLQNTLNLTQNDYNIDGSQAVHVGDVINNFFSPSLNSLPRGSVSTSDDLLEKKRLRRFYQWRAFWISSLLSCLLLSLVALFLIFFFMQPNASKEAAAAVKLIERDDWLRGETKNLSLPIQRIIVDHTADDKTSCENPKECRARVKKILFENRHLNDIPYNFLIGGDGSVIEGRGFQYEGEHTSNSNGSSFDDIGICIAFIGTFSNESLSEAQTESFRKFVLYFISEGLISANYRIFLRDQLAKPKESANALLEFLRNLPQFHSSERPLKICCELKIIAKFQCQKYFAEMSGALSHDRAPPCILFRLCSGLC